MALAELPRSAAVSAPVPAAGHCCPMPLQDTLKPLQAGLAQSLVGVLSLGPWYTQDLLVPSKHLWIV